ncbi:MAG TPA: hypothetical protein PLI71_09390 [Clostridia bacterium]|nr:hypothetical protein [Clostridia bacterium]
MSIKTKTYKITNQDVVSEGCGCLPGSGLTQRGCPIPLPDDHLDVPRKVTFKASANFNLCMPDADSSQDITMLSDQKHEFEVNPDEYPQFFAVPSTDDTTVTVQILEEGC